jgi:hypothetical protein
MDSLLDRLAAIDAARLVAASSALLMLLLIGAWVVGAVGGHWQPAGLGAAALAGVLALIGLLYAFELGTPSASR